MVTLRLLEEETCKMTSISAVDAKELVTGTHPDPFAVLGPHQHKDSTLIRAFLLDADAVVAIDAETQKFLIALTPVIGAEGLFEGVFEAGAGTQRSPLNYRLQASKGKHQWIFDDPYRFAPVLGELDEHLIGEGAHLRLWEVLGAHVITHQHVTGTHFAVWAPNARRVSVVGDFNGWDGRRHCMRRRGQTGVWETFLPDVLDGEPYKFELLDSAGTLLPQKADPVGFRSEHPPRTASVIADIGGHQWQDQAWISHREAKQRIDQPMSVYEVHLGSWRLVSEAGNRPQSYLELSQSLIGYAKDLGFTHIELMPISEFPFDGSWGYQPVGLFAPTIRYGTAAEFRGFVEACHAADLGLILDWVPGHFPEDEHGLGQFDGTALYEHADRREGFHPDWNTLVYNYGRREVANYLSANALYWLHEFHIDGLRVDAVASMLYRDYSRKNDEWIPNAFGGRENLEAIAFLQQVNETCYGQMPGIMTIAEESTTFPGVCSMTSSGGLGFGYKWNMGWMNDTLSYMQEDPINRKYHHHKMTFGLQYAFSENFVLPLSHDEVVHGKGSLLEKMPGNWDDKFANLRAYYGYMWGHPGKKLLFMGCEIAQSGEWNHQTSIDWHLLEYPQHSGMQRLVKDLNALYVSTPALYQLDCKPEGFEWIDANAEADSVFVWVRHAADGSAPVLIVCNFTPVERSAYRVGVPLAGQWLEVLNTDAEIYAGGGRGNLGGVHSEAVETTGREHSLALTLPPLSTLIFKHEQ